MNSISDLPLGSTTQTALADRPSKTTHRVRRDPAAFATTLMALAGAVLVAASAAAESGMLGGGADGACPHCKEGVCYQEVVTYRCKQVPDNKPIKKTVYECREVPYCQHKLPKLGHGGCCPECEACPKFKKVLVKKEIVIGETCGTKCVPEKFVERIPVPCCRCGYTPPGAVTKPASNAAPAAGPTATFAIPPANSVDDEPTPASRRVSDNAATSRLLQPTRTEAPANLGRASGRRTAVGGTSPSAAIARPTSPSDVVRQAAAIAPLKERLPAINGSQSKSVRLSLLDKPTSDGVHKVEGGLIRLMPVEPE